MNERSRFVAFTATILFVFIFVLASPITALADDGAPPPDSTPVPTEETSAEPVEADVSAAEILDQVPEGTEVVVLDEDGEVLPLAAEAAAQAFLTGDPQFCPAGQLPVFMAGTCTGGGAVQASIAAALTDAQIIGGNGIIWVEAGTFTEDVTIDGTSWTGTFPTVFGVIGAGSGVTFLDGYFYILNMQDFSLAGFTVEDVGGAANATYISADSNTGDLQITDVAVTNDSGVGVQVSTHSGDITLTNVTANDNAGNGAYLSNTSGTGAISVDASEFAGNVGYGLFAQSYGDITLTDVYAHNNGLTGAYLENTFGTGGISVGVNLSTYSEFSYNGGDGLAAYSFGNISLADVYAHNNTYDGAYLNNSYMAATGTLDVDSSEFSYNGYGLEAFSRGNLTATDVYSHNNGLDGAYLDNDAGTGTLFVDGGEFSYNNGYGLNAYSQGDLTLTDVYAHNNDLNGAYLDNTSGTGDIYVNVSALTSSEFGNNGGDGLAAYSFGTITLADVYAHDNDMDGAHLNNSYNSASGNIFVDTSEFSWNDGAGITAYSDDYIFLDGVHAHDNAFTGASLDNSGGTGYIFVDGGEYDWNGYEGLTAYSTDYIFLDGLDVHDNGYSGAYLDNTSGTGYIFVDGGEYHWNGYDGLTAFSTDYIFLDGLDVHDNGDTGAYLDNTFGTGYIFVDGGEYSWSGSDGLTAYSNDYIFLDGVHAHDNGYSGAYLDNSGGTGYIFVDGGEYDWNDWDGLTAFSSDYIFLASVYAHDNGLSGAYLDNTYGAEYIFVDPSEFSWNGLDGLAAFSNGDITLLDVNAHDNVGDGAFLSTCANADVDTSVFQNNDGYGLSTQVGGTLTLGTISFGSGNTSGDTLAAYLDCTKKAGLVYPSLPLNIVPVTGGEGIALDCAAFRGTMLVLPNGDSALFPCPINDTASLAALADDALPGDLPDGNAFLSGFTAGVERDGSSVSEVDSFITVSFVVPDGQADAKLAILFWDGSQWTKVNGGKTTDAAGVLHFEAVTKLTGTFVLVAE